MRLVAFLTLAFGISLAAFVGIAFVPGAGSPDDALGLAFWLPMVWGPSLAAIILSARHGKLATLLRRAVQVSTVPIEVWGLMLGPLLVLLLLRPFAPGESLPIGFGAIATSIAFNLVLGPLGEELGWRGILQERLNRRMGWLQASLLVGVVWLLWHLPLWAIDSPHAEIPLPLFAVHCLLYAVLIGAAHTLSGGSILPAILVHLTVNLAANWAIFAGYHDPEAWFGASLGHYAVLAGCAVVIVHAKTGRGGLGWALRADGGR